MIVVRVMGMMAASASSGDASARSAVCDRIASGVCNGCVRQQHTGGAHADGRVDDRQVLRQHRHAESCLRKVATSARVGSGLVVAAIRSVGGRLATFGGATSGSSTSLGAALLLAVLFAVSATPAVGLLLHLRQRVVGVIGTGLASGIEAADEVAVCRMGRLDRLSRLCGGGHRAPVQLVGHIDGHIGAEDVTVLRGDAGLVVGCVVRRLEDAWENACTTKRIVHVGTGAGPTCVGATNRRPRTFGRHTHP